MIQSILINRNIRIYTKINILKAYVWFILLHGCECWTLTKDLERLEAAEKWYIRRRMRIELKRRSNGYGRLQKIPIQNHHKLTTTIFGHINRADGPKEEQDNGQNAQTESLNNEMSSSGEVTIERIGSSMSATDLSHGDDDDDDGDHDHDDGDDDDDDEDDDHDDGDDDDDDHEEEEEEEEDDEDDDDDDCDDDHDHDHDEDDDDDDNDDDHDHDHDKDDDDEDDDDDDHHHHHHDDDKDDDDDHDDDEDDDDDDDDDNDDDHDYDYDDDHDNNDNDLIEHGTVMILTLQLNNFTQNLEMFNLPG